MRKYSFGAGIVRDIKSPFTQPPFTTISSTVSSQENVENATNELNMQKQKLLKTLPINSLPFTTITTTTTNSNTDTLVDEENRTPNTMPIRATTTTTTTPVKMSIPMNMAMTPAPFGGDLVKEIEYSFEEIRLGFVLA